MGPEVGTPKIKKKKKFAAIPFLPLPARRRVVPPPPGEVVTRFAFSPMPAMPAAFFGLHHFGAKTAQAWQASAKMVFNVSKY